MKNNCHINPETGKGWAWKGGSTKSNNYRLIRSPSHPYADANGYVREHRLIVEKKIGRYLLPGEEVHHKDGDTLNNDLNNLQLLSKEEHARIHNNQWQKKYQYRTRGKKIKTPRKKKKTIIITTRRGVCR